MRASLLLVLVAGVLLTGCSSMSAKDVLRTTQSAVNVKNLYGNSTIKEEAAWRLRSIYGQ
jgi:uncharacterized protein YceK